MTCNTVFGVTPPLNCLLPLWLLCGLFCFLRAEGCFKTRSTFFFYFIAVGTIARTLSLSQYFLNYCGCYSNLRPLQDIAAGGIWYGRDSVQLSSLLCTELKVILGALPLLSGPTASAATFCPSQLASESSSLPFHLAFSIHGSNVCCYRNSQAIWYQMLCTSRACLFWEVATCFKPLPQYMLFLRDMLRAGAVLYAL